MQNFYGHQESEYEEEEEESEYETVSS